MSGLWAHRSPILFIAQASPSRTLLDTLQQFSTSHLPRDQTSPVIGGLVSPPHIDASSDWYLRNFFNPYFSSLLPHSSCST